MRMPKFILSTKMCRLAFVSCLLLGTTNLFAQETETPNTQTSIPTQENQSKADRQDDNIERIEVTAGFNNKAMKAFNSGQFDIAEIEFKKNAVCARIVESNQQATIDTLVNNTIRGEIKATGTGTNTNIESNVNNTVAPSVNYGGGAVAISTPNEKIKKLACTNRGFQLYMTGMSQIQLGRAQEAEENFETATFLNKNLYDAHHRLALMKLLRDDVKGAEDEFASMKRILNRCRKCDVRDEIIARVDFIEKALNGEIKLR